LALQNSTLDLNGADTGAVVFDSSLSAATVGGLTGSRDRALTNSSNAALALTVGNNNTTVGPYSGALSGGGSLTKVGTGTQKISGNNTYSGGTNINLGTLQFGQTVSMPLTGAVAVNNGATLAVNVGGSGEWTNSSVVTDPASIGGLIVGTGGRGTLNQVTWNSGSALGIDTTNAAAPVTYSANIGNFNGTNNSVGLTKLGAGTLQISGANTYTGTTTIGAGTSATPSVLKMGAANTLPASTVVVMPTATNSNAKLELFDDSSNPYDQTIAGLSGGGGGTFATATNVNVGFATLTINTAASQNYTYDGFLTTDSDIFDDTHHGKVVKNGDGGLTITGNNGTPPFKGEFIMNAGTLGIGNNQSFGPTTGLTSKLTINGGTLANTTGSSLNLSVRNIDINGSFTFNLTSANDSQMIGNAGLQTVTLNADTTITEVPSAPGNQNSLIWAGTLTDNASGPARSLTKMGTGLMTLLSSANSYRGNTIIKEGILRVGKTTTANVPAGGGRMGDGNGTVYLSGGMLTYNGSMGSSDSTRTITVPNPVVMDASSSISYISTTSDLAGLNDVSFIFSNNSISGTAGTLTLVNQGTSTTSKFRPQFSGSGFNFSQPVVIDNGTGTRTTTLESTNSSGTQTWSGNMSGSGGYRRSDLGSTVFMGSNSFTGGTIVDGGVLTVTGSSATFGGGDVTVNAGNAAISAGVANAIANTKKLTLLGGGAPGMADVGYIALAAGINERVTSLVLGTTAQPDGTYGAPGSGAANTLGMDEYFSGTGIITVGPAGLPGDFNSDGKVDAGDYATWRKNEVANAALPNDNSVGSQAARFSLWRANFGNVAGAGTGGGLNGGSTVPEPGALSLLIYAVGSLVASGRLSRRRRD
jgi:autotransporter-associated beta strand protein